MPATVLFNLASPCNVLTCFNQILSNYSALKQKSSSLCHNDPNTHNEPPCPFPTMQQVMGLLCQNHQSSMLSIFPLTDTVTLDICMPVLTVISLGWIVWVMTMDTSQQPALSFQKAQHGVKRLTKVISLSILCICYLTIFGLLYFYLKISVMDLPLYSIFWDWLVLSAPNIGVEGKTGWQQKKYKFHFEVFLGWVGAVTF